MKIENSLAVIMERVKQDFIHAEKNIKNLYERDVEIDYDFSHIPSDEKYRIFISVKAKEKPILDDAEKAYLSAVIKPFRNDMKHIIKIRFGTDEEYLQIGIMPNCFYLPNFKAGTMYKGMEVYRPYSLKELGLE